MRLCHEYKLSKSQLFNQFTLSDIFDALEMLDRNGEIEYQYTLEIERKYQKNGR
jgi:hypothetical protein